MSTTLLDSPAAGAVAAFDAARAARPVPRRVAERIPMPWHDFGARSGAWTLHPHVLADFDPLVMVDHFLMPDAVFAPHPHAGFSAVTYLFEDSEGSVANRDTFGEPCVIRPGSLHWTQAGRGMLHEELPQTPGRAAHGLQLFVNSARAHKGVPPAAFRRSAEDVPVVLHESGAAVRVVLGEHDSIVQRIGAHTPITLLDIMLPPGAAIELPLPRSLNATAVLVRGALAGDVQTDPGPAEPQSALRYALRFERGEGDVVAFEAGPGGAQLVLLAGEAIGEPIVAYGPFIGCSSEDVRDMVRRFQSGAMGRLDPSPAPSAEARPSASTSTTF